jgi:hypothetical protein
MSARLSTNSGTGLYFPLQLNTNTKTRNYETPKKKLVFRVFVFRDFVFLFFEGAMQKVRLSRTILQLSSEKNTGSHSTAE